MVGELDEQIATLNQRRYSLQHNRRKILASLNEDRLLFDPDKAEQLFNEAGVVFNGQLKKDFQQLIDFNRSITDERRVYLREEQQEIEEELRSLNASLEALGKRRADILGFLSTTEVFDKYKRLSTELITLRSDITALERQRAGLHSLQELRSTIRHLGEDCRRLQAQIEVDVEKQNEDKMSLFSSLRVFFNEIVEEVIDRKALLSVSPNKKGHLEFRAEILDESSKATSADDGHTYKKLLCIAFDLAVLRAHLQDSFPRFVYHDGVFESLDDRKKEKLLGVIRQYAELGIQSVITLIDSDAPPPRDNVFNEKEIVLTLHDEGDRGRLFRMPAW